jgi:hypothetical protein
MRWQAICEAGPPGGDFDEQGVVIGGDDGAIVGRSAIEAEAEAGGAAVGEDFAVVGEEVVGGVLGGDAALEGVAVTFSIVLGGELHFGTSWR